MLIFKMKDRSKAKKRLALRSRDIHVGWIVGAGVSTAIFLLATFATAYRHDAYSSRLGLKDLMTTDVWLRVFLALTCFSLLLFLGLLVYAFLAGRIGGSGEEETVSWDYVLAEFNWPEELLES